MNEQGDADCAFEMCKGVKECKLYKNNYHYIVMSTFPIQYQYTQTACLTYIEGKYPDLIPTIIHLDTYNANYLQTSTRPFTVYLRGINFSANGITSITFGTYKNIPITFFSSTSISFIIPLNVKQGEYNLQVVNTNSTGSLSSNTVVFTIE